MVTANELIMIFIGLEISSIASYVLAGYLRDDPRNKRITRSNIFCWDLSRPRSCLYGVAWIYGLNGLYQPRSHPQCAANLNAAARAGRRRCR